MITKNTNKVSFREFHLKIVRDSEPNEDGRWISRIVRSDGKVLGSHMLEKEPTYDTVVLKGYQVVQIREVKPGPSDQPGTQAG